MQSISEYLNHFAPEYLKACCSNFVKYLQRNFYNIFLFLTRFPFEDIGINKFYFLKFVMFFWCYGIIVTPSKIRPKLAGLPLTRSNYVFHKS